MPPPEASTLDRYELVERIAVGGMAEVFRARAFGAHGFEKTLAIKRILPDLARDPEFEERFISEAKLAVGLSHANIVQVLDFGRFGGSLYIAMEYVDGLDLAALLKGMGERGQKVPVAAALQIAIELSRGLEFAHQHGVVHRDVSPSNILISRSGDVKLADFGIALAAEVGGAGLGGTRKIMGKWRYMSPEQARGEHLSARSDLFSLGSVLYELFTGGKLFPGEEIEEVVRNVREMPIPAPSSVRDDLPPALDPVLLRCLARPEAERYASAAELHRALVAVSYARTLVVTSMDVAEVVARVAPVPDKVRPADKTPSEEQRLIDDIIRSELLGVAQVASDTGNITRVTAEVQLPALFAPSGTDTGRGAATGSAFVRRSVGPDGITVWEVLADAPDRGADPERTVVEHSAPPAALPAPPPAVPRAASGAGSAGSAGRATAASGASDAPSPDADGPAGADGVPVVVGAQVTDRSSAPPMMERSGPVSPPADEDVPFTMPTAVPALRSSERSRWLVAVALLLLGGAAGGFFALRGRRAASPVIAPGISDADPPGAAQLEVVTDPPGATVTVDGAAWPEPTPTVVPLGARPEDRHQIGLSRPGYRSFDDAAVVVRPGERMRYLRTLEAARGGLRVVSDPPGAQVFLAGESVGDTPLVLADLPALGQPRPLKLVKKGYVEWEGDVTLVDRTVVNVERKLEPVTPETRYGKIDLIVEPWAYVSWNGQRVSDGSVQGLRLPVGKQKLVLENPALGKSKTVVVDVPERGSGRVVVDMSE
jgi:serine/threonine protein kinase